MRYKKSFYKVFTLIKTFEQLPVYYEKQDICRLRYNCLLVKINIFCWNQVDLRTTTFNFFNDLKCV